MRNLIVTSAVLAVLVACGGGGSREAALAKTARYKGDKVEIFNAMKTVIEDKLKLASSDETTLVVLTTNRWYTPEGLVTTSGEQDLRQIPDKSLLIGFVVKLLPDGESWIVLVDAKIARHNKGMPNLEPRPLKSIDLPNWVASKADQLALDIHKGLAKYEVKGVPAVAPGPAAPAPAAPAPAPDPAAGSAAP